KYLEHRLEHGLVDQEYFYARASLMHYAQWMAANESLYLSCPERLEFPTETWAAQDTRKAAVFEFAALHASSASERRRFMESAEFFFDQSVSSLNSKSTRS